MRAERECVRRKNQLLLKLLAAVYRYFVAKDFLRRRERDGDCLRRSILTDMDAHPVERDFPERGVVEKHRLFRERHDGMIAKEILAETTFRAECLLLIDVPELSLAVHICDVRSGGNAHAVGLLVGLDREMVASHVGTPPRN